MGFTPPHDGSRHVRGHVGCMTRRGEDLGEDATVIVDEGGLAGCALEAGSLAPGDALVMRYWGLAPRIAGTYALEARTRVSGGRGGARLTLESPLEVLPREAARLRLVAPSEVERGAPLGLALVALDPFGNRAEAYAGSVRVSLEDDTRERVFTPEDRGIIVLQGFHIARDGFSWAEAVEIEGAPPAYRLEARSNPIHVVESGALRPVLWGDLHFHTGTGAGADRLREEAAGDHRGNYTTEEAAYAHARDVSRLDFAAATEHAVHGFDASAWERSRNAALRFNEPGLFTTFPGYHWRDRLVILPGDDGPLLDGDDRASDEPGELARALRDAGAASALVIALGSPQDGADAVEIYSWRNRSDGYVDRPARFEPGAGWLDRVETPGFPPVSIVAASATHWGNPGTRNRTGLEPGAGGLTAVRATRGDRDAILEALRAGNSWATTGARIYLAVNREGGVALRVTAAGQRDLQQVSLVVVDEAGASEIALLEGPADRIDTVVPFPSSGGRGFCFLRARQVDGETAWSAPIPIPGSARGSVTN